MLSCLFFFLCRCFFEQLEKVDTVYQQIQETSREEILASLADELAGRLGVRKEQLTEVREIVREEIEQRHQLLAGLMRNPERPEGDVLSDLQTIQEKTRSRLDPFLSPEHKSILRERQEQLQYLIREVYFGIAVPRLQKIKE